MSTISIDDLVRSIASYYNVEEDLYLGKRAYQYACIVNFDRKLKNNDVI